jgi:hypothetical protein
MEPASLSLHNAEIDFYVWHQIEAHKCREARHADSQSHELIRTRERD